MSALRGVESMAPGQATFQAERLAGVIDVVTDPITVQDRSGRIVFANAAAVRVSGQATFEDLFAADWPARLDRFEMSDAAGHSVDAADLPARRTLRTGLPQTLVLHWRDRESGAQGWSSLSSVPLVDAAGKPEFAVNMTHDITAAKVVEEALRTSEARSRLLADATRDLDESLDLDRTIDTAMALAAPHLADWATLDLVQDRKSVV